MTETRRASPLSTLTLKTVTSWQVVLGGVVLYPLFRFIGDPPYPDASALTYLVGIIGPAIALVMMLVLARLIAHAVRWRPVGAVVVTMVVLAAVLAQAMVPAGGSVVATARQSAPAITILTEATLLSLLWIATALAYLSVSAYVEQARSLRTREEALEGELVALDGRTHEEQERITRSIGEIADGTLADLNSSSLDEISAVLRGWSEEVVRPLSRDLAADSDALGAVEGREAASPWVTAARSVTSRDPIPVLLITAVALAASPGLLFRSYPPATAAWALASVTALTALGAFLVNAVTRPLLPRVTVPWRMLIIYVACLPLAFAELIPFTLPALLGQGQEQTEQSLSALWLGPAVSPVFVLFIVWLRIAVAAGDQSLSLAQSRTRELAIQVATRNLYLRQRRKAWAHALHGQVQSAMLAASIRLDRERRNGSLDRAAVEQACEPVWQALTAAQNAYVDPPRWHDAVARLGTLWDGLIALRLSVDPVASAVIDRSGICRSGVIDVMTESISNAVRHGHAHEVDITITVGGASTLLVTVVDDGRPIDVSRPQGLGSALLAEVSVEWSLERSGNRNTLKVELPALQVPEPDSTDGRPLREGSLAIDERQPSHSPRSGRSEKADADN